MERIPDDPTVVQPIYDQLKASFLAGKTRPISYRKQQLKNLLKGMKEIEEKIHEAWDKDLGGGKFASQMLSYHITIGEIEECLSKIEKWNAPQSVDTPLAIGPAKSYLLPEPLGVVLIIGSWNYPISLTIPYAASAIAAGNCVILKTSELAPHSSQVVAEIFEKYLDKECYRVIEGKVEVAKAVTKLPVDKIVFTGSTEKGKLVAMAAAQNLTPCVLELGGKSPTIVDKDAHIENAALRIAQGRFMNCGQTCIACDYLFVHKDIKDKFIPELKKKVIEYFGQDAHKSPDYGRIINDFHAKRLKGYLDENHGGKVILGGEVNLEEKYIAPTLVETPSLESKLMQDEIFGPILPILYFENIDEVIKFINERPKPLALYYYGPNSSSNYKNLKYNTSSGALVTNESVFHFASLFLPFGGVGASGMGYVHGYNGFKELVHMKPVMEKGTINFYPFNVRYPPYSEHRKKLMLMLLKYPGLKQSHMYKGIGLLVLIGATVFAHKKGYLTALKDIIVKALTRGK